MRFFESRFSDSAEEIVRLSSKVASQMGHNYVGTEHLLYSTLLNNKLIASEVLTECGIDKTSVSEKIDEIFTTEESVSNICFNCMWHEKCLFYQKLSNNR